MQGTIQLKPKSPLSRWVAVDVNNKIIAEGKRPEIVSEKAKRVTEIFFLVYVPKKGDRYVF